MFQRDTVRGLAGEWWRLATAMLVHVGVGHLLFDLAGIVLVGIAVERWAGHLRWLVIYLGSGVAAGRVSVLIAPHSVDVGASGGVAGLIGALMVEIVRRRQLPWWQAWLYSGFFVLYLAGLAWGGPIGGAVTGSLAIAALVTVRRAAGHVPLRRVELVAAAVGTVALAAHLDVHGWGLVAGAALGLALPPRTPRL